MSTNEDAFLPPTPKSSRPPSLRPSLRSPLLPGSLRLRSRAAPAEAGVTRAFAQSELDFKPGSSASNNSDAASIMSMYQQRMEDIPETRQTGSRSTSQPPASKLARSNSTYNSSSRFDSTLASGSQVPGNSTGSLHTSNHPRAASTLDWLTFRSPSKGSKRSAQEVFRNAPPLEDDPMMDSVETIRPSAVQLQRSSAVDDATLDVTGDRTTEPTTPPKTQPSSTAASPVERRPLQNGGTSIGPSGNKHGTWFGIRRRRHTEGASESSDATIRPRETQSTTIASSRDPTSRPGIPSFLPPRPTSPTAPIVVEPLAKDAPQATNIIPPISREASSKIGGPASVAETTATSKKGWFGLPMGTTVVGKPTAISEERSQNAVVLTVGESVPIITADLGANAIIEPETKATLDITGTPSSTLTPPASTSPPSRGWFGTMVGGTAVPSLKGKEVDPRERVAAPQSPSNFISEPQPRSDPPVDTTSSSSTNPITLTSIAPPEAQQGHDHSAIGPATSTLAMNSASGRFTLGFPLLARRANILKPRNGVEPSMTAQSLAANLGLHSTDATYKPRDVNLDIDVSALPTPTIEEAFRSESNSLRGGSGSILRTAAHPPPATKQLNSPVVPAIKATDDQTSTSTEEDVDRRSSSSNPDDTTLREVAAPWWSYFGLGGGPTAPPQAVTIVQTPAAEEPNKASTTQSALVDHSGVSASGSGYAVDLVPEFGDGGLGPRQNAGSSSSFIECGDQVGNSTVQSKKSEFETDENKASFSQDARQPASTLMSWMGPLLSLAYPTAPSTTDSTIDAPTKSEAELFKEATLKTSSPAPVSEVPPPTVASEASASSPSTSSLLIAPNPVVTHAQTKSWVSFFSSRNTLAVKRVTDEGQVPPDGQDMEVMDIPDELDNPTILLGSPPKLKAVIDPRLEDISRTAALGKVSPSQSRASSHERGRALKQLPDGVAKKELPTLARTGPQGKGTPGPSSRGSPLLTSASSLRTNSPDPSVTGRKHGGKKPNAVLPTFGDTFFTLPRVMVPPPTHSRRPGNTLRRSSIQKRMPSGLTKKTLNVLASWFPSYTAVLNPSSGEARRPPSEEMVQYLEERRMRIERSWLGKSYDPSPSPLNSPSSTSLASQSSQSIKPQQPRFAIATGSGSEHSARAASLLGISAQQSALGRIAPKGHGHLNSSQFSTPSAMDVAKSVGTDLPRAWDALETGTGGLGPLSETKRAVVIGIHGWFPGTMIRTVLGEPTGTSSKLASMMATSVENFVEQHGITLEKLTVINLEGEGTIAVRVAKLYQDLLNHPDWVEDLHNADVVFVSSHSQGSIVSTHLLASLIADGHIRPIVSSTSSKTCSVVCLALCGIHLGPLLYLNGSLTQPYFTYFESAAARELFEFQDTSSDVSQRYTKALSEILDYGVKMVYIASVDDQVVPIYSGTFMTASHPLILRALYIDGDAFKASEFIIFLLVLLISIRNAGLADSGLITHLSEATAGSLSGVGHSTPYLSTDCYDLAVRFLFETTGVIGDEKPEFRAEPFQARATRNDYEIPWALRGVISDPAILSLFGSEIAELRRAFDDWSPKTAILKDLRRKLEPIQSLRILPTSPLSQNIAPSDTDTRTPSSRL